MPCTPGCCSGQGRARLATGLPTAHAHTRQATCQAATETFQDTPVSKRAFLASSAAAAAALAAAARPAQAAGLDPFAKKDLRPPKQRGQVDESQYNDGPQGLKYYDVKIGDGPKAAEGDRVAVHYECKWKGVTFQTSRIGPGVTGGEPYGFDIGATGNTKALRGMDVGVRGMQKGGVRKLIVPPELGYGNVQVMEIPPNATLEVSVELLSVKNTPLGYKARPKFSPAESSAPAKKTMFADA